MKEIATKRALKPISIAIVLLLSALLICNSASAYTGTWACNKADIVFVFDTTGSMGSSISSMKTNAINFANSLSAKGIDYRLGLTEMRDFPTVCSGGCGDSTDLAYKIYNGGTLTDSSTFNSWINALTAGGGADLPEAILAALKHSATDQRWRGGDVRKFIVLISDAPPHADGQCCNAEGDTMASVRTILQNNKITLFIAGENAGGSGVPANWASDLAAACEGKYYPLGDLTPILNDVSNIIPCGCRNPSFGVYRPMTATFWLDTDKDGLLDKQVKYGVCGDVPLTGDWNGDGRFGIGVFRPSTVMWALDNNLDGVTDKRITYGLSNDLPITGDWNGDGLFGIGVFRPSTGTWSLDDNLDGKTDKTVAFGRPNDLPITGDWNMDGKDGIGVYRPDTKMFYLDNNLDGVTDSTVNWATESTSCADHRLCNDVPLTGKCWFGTFAPTKHTFYAYNPADTTKSKVKKDYDDTVDIPLTGSWK